MRSLPGGYGMVNNKLWRRLNPSYINFVEDTYTKNVLETCFIVNKKFLSI